MEEEPKLTKRERKALAKEQKREEREAKEKKDKMTKWGVVVVVLLIIGFIGYRYFRAPSSDSVPNDNTLQATFEVYATDMGLNVEQFRADMQSDVVKDKVNADMASGNALNLNSTPSFILNGEMIDSGSFANLEELISNAIGSNTQGSIDITISEADHTKGNPDAAVKLVEYGDYQCPACAGVNPAVNQVIENMGEDIMLVYRHFPLVNIHPNALAAAYAAEAAAIQGKFWEMHDKLYENQQEWSSLK